MEPTCGQITNNPLISVVVPVYNAEKSLNELLERIIITLRLKSFEIICVDDCSLDASWKVLKDLKKQHGKLLKIARLQKNNGQHNALLCGFSMITGQVVVTIDDDLQNPPEEIPKLLTLIDQGYDLVVGAYENKQHPAFRNVSGSIVDLVIRKIFRLPKSFQLTSFRAIRRSVVVNTMQMGGVFPYVTAMLLSHTSKYANVAVQHDQRKHNVSNYSLRRSLRLAANLIISYSTIPVIIVGFACMAAFIFSITFGAYTLISAMIQGSAVPGWASTVVILSFFNALTLLCLFIFAFYISRITQQLTGLRVSFAVAEVYSD